MKVLEKSRRCGNKAMSASLLYQAIMSAKDAAKIFIPSVSGADRIITVNVRERKNDRQN